LTWRYVTAELGKAAAGADVTDVAIALSLALMLEKVEAARSEIASLPAALGGR
jgi:hypothetical protein